MSFFTSMGKALGTMGRKAGKPSSPSPQPSVQTQTFSTPAAAPQAPPPAREAFPMNTPLPGKNGYTPTTAPYGMDQSNPGVQEQYWNQNQNLWNKGMSAGPGQGEQFWNQVQGTFNKTNQDLTPQFNKFYDQASAKATGEANKQAAARGVYGSSQALNNVGNIAADIEGQRAKASTDFMFGNAANQTQNLSQMGNLAFGAQGMANNRNAMDLSALNSGYQAAGQAQNQRDSRIQNQFNNTSTMTGMYLPFLQSQYGNMMDTDLGLVTGAQEAKVAATANDVANQQNHRQQNSNDFNNGAAVYGAFSGGNSQPQPQQPQYAPTKGYYQY